MVATCDVHRLAPRGVIAQLGAGGDDGRRELLARGDHLAHRGAPQATVEAAQGHLGDGLLAAQGLVAGFQVHGGAQTQ
ncbi:hypothetical protein G6F46_014989 [Rhizopus delemar]|nr:hypothetical protein G6F46_014989 [Rhizopus delemar]